MALSLVDIEMALPEDLYKDKSDSKHDACGSPFSQASTAPCTPIRFFLPDPFVVSPPPQLLPAPTRSPYQILSDPPQLGFDVPPPQLALDVPCVPAPQVSFSFCVTQPPLCICISPCWAEYKQAGEPQIITALPKPKRCKIQLLKPKARVSKPLLSIGVSPWWAQYKQGWKDSIRPPLRLRNPLPKAHAPVYPLHFVEVKNHSCSCMPRNQQEFAILEFIYKQEYPVKKVLDYLPRNQQHFAVLNYMIKHEDKVTKAVPIDDSQQSVFLKYYQHMIKDEKKVPKEAPIEDSSDADLIEDCEWEIQGPNEVIHFDDDEDDEWLQVGELYTPSVLEGMCVLTSNPDSVGVAGRALTPDGRVIELNSGGPVDFSREAETSSGHTRKADAIKSAKARLAKVARDVDVEKICSIDADGTVRGGAAVESVAAGSKKDRLKLFHRKRTHRQTMASSKAARHSQELSIDASGHVFLFNVKKARRAARVQISNSPRSVMTIDGVGVVYETIECWDVRRGLDVNPDVVLIMDATGTIRIHDDPFAGL